MFDGDRSLFNGQITRFFIVKSTLFMVPCHGKSLGLMLKSPFYGEIPYVL